MSEWPVALLDNKKYFPLSYFDENRRGQLSKDNSGLDYENNSMTYDLELFLFLLLFLSLNLFVFILFLRSMMNCLVSASSHKSNERRYCKITLHNTYNKK